jgi:predicted PolB exonuclease-like 3'-5' exonuclease
MIQKEAKYKTLYFDVETASGEKSLDILIEKNPRLADLWSKRSDFYRGAYSEMKDMSDSEIYEIKSPLEAEFCRVVCVSFGTFDADDEMRKTSFYGEDEADILSKSNKVFFNAEAKGWKICGHNIKNFDIPCLGKRMIYNSILPSRNLQMWDKKPWEAPIVDTSEVFSFGNWMQQKYLGLDLLACSMGIKSPKDGIKGSEVSSFFWDSGDVEGIKEYCERDVETVMEIISKLSSL